MKFVPLIVAIDVYFLHSVRGFSIHSGWITDSRHGPRFSRLSYKSLSNSHSDDPAAAATTKAFASPVLSQVYPALVSFKDKFGHANIPLGSSEGRQCETLRRLHVQGKLVESDVTILNELGFRWHSLEDVYYTADFDALLCRLQEYAKLHDGDVSPPKKYEPDPELGAWVTGIRRVGRQGVQSSHAAALDEIGFSWTSKRQCGSSFMNQYRDMKRFKDDVGDEAFLENEKVQLWIRAQQDAAARGTLSETRVHYMEQLIPDWQRLVLK